uniref:Protein LNK2 n=1 Tax=Setaria italica TaxID=4555 RepID=K3XF81_SETIT
METGEREAPKGQREERRRKQLSTGGRGGEERKGRRGCAVPASWGGFPTAGDATVGTRREVQFGLGFVGGTRGGGRHLSRMFDWNDEQQQVGDAIWAEFNDSEDHIVPYPKHAEDSTLVRVGNHKNNDEEAASIADITKHSAGDQTELQGMEKQHANQTSAHFSATRLDMESWPDLPSLNPALDRNYSDDNIASTYLDFSAEPSLQKVTGNTTVQLDGESEVFGNDHEEKSSSFLDCDWGNIGDFDDFDRLFSNSDSIFGNEVVANDSDFLSASSDMMDNVVQSIPIPQVPLNKQPLSHHGPSLLLINEISGGITKQENKGDVQKRPVRSRRKQEERGKSKLSSDTSGFSQSKVQNPSASLQAPMQPVQTPQYALFQDSKNMGQVQHSNQFICPGYGYPAYPFPTIPLVSNIQAEDHQRKPAATSYQTSADSPKHSSSIEMSQDIPSRPLRMTPKEKIEKLRRRQQMQALIAIQQQQQQFGQEGSGSDTIVLQPYSPRNKNADSLGSSIVIDENTNKDFLPEMIPTSHDEVHKSFAISEDPFIEEKIYYQLQDALGKLDTKTRLCIRDSLLRLACSATERQIAGDRSSTNKTTKDEDEASEHDTSTRRTRSPTKEAETTTNPIDRIVAHLLFQRHCSKVATATKEEIISSTHLKIEPESKVPLETPRVPSEDRKDKQEMVLQPSQ